MRMMRTTTRMKKKTKTKKWKTAISNTHSPLASGRRRRMRHRTRRPPAYQKTTTQRTRRQSLSTTAFLTPEYVTHLPPSFHLKCV